MSRRQSETTVSIFPFLAVLVCTMGALILLLLVITRRIRHEAAERSNVQAAVDAVAEPSLPEPVIEPQPPAPSVPEKSLEELRQQYQAAAARKHQLEQQIRAQRDRQRQLQTQITTAEAEIVHRTSAAARQSAQKRAELNSLIERRTRLQDELDQSRRKVTQLQKELEQQTLLTEKGERMLRERESALISLRRLADQRSQSTDVAADTVIEFTNSTGTQRSPIIVDVSDKGFQLVPSGVMIRREDMDGFPANDNPLLAAILAVHDTRHPVTISVRPYVLLLVRPSGSLAFYAAQRTLQTAGIHFGYELIEADRRVRVSPGAPEEGAAAQKAIAASIDRRQQLYGALMARIDRLRESSRVESRSSERRFRVLPDGRVVESGEALSEAEKGRFYAGGHAPPNRHRPEDVAWDAVETGAENEATVDAADRQDSGRATTEGGSSASQSESMAADFPPLIKQEKDSQSPAYDGPIIIAGTSAGPSADRDDSYQSTQSPDARSLAGRQPDSRSDDPNGAASFIDAPAKAPTSVATADRTDAQSRSSRPNSGTAPESSDTRPAGTAERPSVFAEAAPPFSRQGDTTVGGSATDSQNSSDYLSRFLNSVAQQKDGRRPNPVLLKLLQSAVGSESASNEGENLSGTLDQSPGDRAATETQRGVVVAILLTEDRLKIARQPVIGISGWRADRLLSAILDGLSRELRAQGSSPSGPPPQVRFYVTPAMQGTQEYLSQRLEELKVRTVRTAVAPSDAEKSSSSVPEQLPEPAEPVEPVETPPVRRRSI